MSGYKYNGRRFGFTMAGAFTFFALIFLYKQRMTVVTVLGSLVALFLLFALVAPKVLEPVERVWMAFARVLGAINTRIIMGLFYFLIFVPLSLLFKVVGRDEMRRRWSSGAQTNWDDYRPRQRDARHYENMF
ncbi:MAG TPA: SxtJ family membrane protein [Pyrinomonadaceae bacterium]|nr:SxtJ family membrane protein [Pyrinomonadaceae bacterium]